MSVVSPGTPKNLKEKFLPEREREKDGGRERREGGENPLQGRHFSYFCPAPAKLLQLVIVDPHISLFPYPFPFLFTSKFSLHFVTCSRTWQKREREKSARKTRLRRNEGGSEEQFLSERSLSKTQNQSQATIPSSSSLFYLWHFFMQKNENPFFCSSKWT